MLSRPPDNALTAWTPCHKDVTVGRVPPPDTQPPQATATAAGQVPDPGTIPPAPPGQDLPGRQRVGGLRQLVTTPLLPCHVTTQLTFPPGRPVFAPSESPSFSPRLPREERFNLENRSLPRIPSADFLTNHPI